MNLRLNWNQFDGNWNKQIEKKKLNTSQHNLERLFNSQSIKKVTEK